MTAQVITPAFTPREYQRPMLKARANGVKRGVVIWHRRAGKDLTVLNMLWTEALKRVGLYNYYFPTFALGKAIIWKGMDKDGKPFLSYIPQEAIKDRNETEMRLELVNGSIIRIVGTDNISQNIVGINPIGCVFSEYSLQDPMAWELTRPILAENGGWAWFVYTPRGRNHGHSLWEVARQHPETWFSQVLTINDTKLPSGLPVITPEYVSNEILEGMDPDLAQQEYYCSFDAPMQGSYYGRLLADAYSTGRVDSVAWTPAHPVHCGWDIGVGDQTAIWFAQVVGDSVRLIDYYENTGEGFDHYFKVVMEKPYTYGTMYMPHDVAKTEWGTGKSLVEMVTKSFAERSVKVKVVPRMEIDEGITAARRMFPRLRIDLDRCGKKKYRGHSALDCLASYHKKWNVDKLEYEDKPHHNWASHCADALRYLALGLKDAQPKRVQTRYRTSFDPMRDANEDTYETEFDPFNYERTIDMMEMV